VNLLGFGMSCIYCFVGNLIGFQKAELKFKHEIIFPEFLIF
jgi:hypothetical protein